MPRRRDRHARGMRGPLVTHSSLVGGVVPLRQSADRPAFFVACLQASISRINHRCPGLLVGIDIGFEDVPGMAQLWADQRVPLAAALDASDERAARIVLFRRPLERRAATRPQLAALVHTTLVEQVAALTGRLIDDIDPTIYDEGL